MNNNYYQAMLYRDYLMHYGIQGKSGRYKWGSGDRPYQRLEKGKRVGFFAKRKEKKAAKEKAKQQKEILEKKKADVERQKQEAEERKKLTAEKNEMLKSGSFSPEMMKKYLSVMTNAEVENAVKRIELLEKLEKYTPKEKSTFDTVDGMFTKLGKVNKWGSTALDSYKTVKTFVDYLDDASKKSKKEKEASKQQDDAAKKWMKEQSAAYYQKKLLEALNAQQGGKKKK